MATFAQQVWFAPNDDLARGPNRDRFLNRDFPHLFDPEPVASGIRAARGAGTRAGIILDGAGPGASDADSVAAYRRNMQTVEAAGLEFDLVVANWTPHPARNLLESDPDTLTSVLAWYQTHRGGKK